MATSWKSTTTGYGWLPVTLHWLMLLLIAAVYATMEFKSIFPKGSAGRDAMALWHFMLGLTVFVLAWVRVGARVAGATPLIEPAMPDWQALIARVMHWALYTMMIGLPLLGWLTLSAKGKPVPFFGFELPALVGADEALGKSFKKLHEGIATGCYALIGAHAAAALFHHYIKRDNTLKLMLPGR
jgi:cytochrome b561